MLRPTILVLEPGTTFLYGGEKYEVSDTGTPTLAVAEVDDVENAADQYPDTCLEDCDDIVFFDTRSFVGAIARDDIQYAVNAEQLATPHRPRKLDPATIDADDLE